MCELKVHKFLTRTLSFHHLQGSGKIVKLYHSSLSNLPWGNNSGTKTKPSQGGWTTPYQPSQPDKETAFSTLVEVSAKTVILFLSHLSRLAQYSALFLYSPILPVTHILNNSCEIGTEICKLIPIKELNPEGNTSLSTKSKLTGP